VNQQVMLDVHFAHSRHGRGCETGAMCEMSFGAEGGKRGTAYSSICFHVMLFMHLNMPIGVLLVGMVMFAVLCTCAVGNLVQFCEGLWSFRVISPCSSVIVLGILLCCAPIAYFWKPAVAGG